MNKPMEGTAHRREILANISIGLTAVLAGCSGDSGDSKSDGPGTSATDRTESPSPSDTTTSSTENSRDLSSNGKDDSLINNEAENIVLNKDDLPQSNWNTVDSGPDQMSTPNSNYSNNAWRVTYTRETDGDREVRILNEVSVWNNLEWASSYYDWYDASVVFGESADQSEELDIGVESEWYGGIHETGITSIIKVKDANAVGIIHYSQSGEQLTVNDAIQASGNLALTMHNKWR